MAAAGYILSSENTKIHLKYSMAAAGHPDTYSFKWNYLNPHERMGCLFIFVVS
jgi:hypothetical protein